MRLVAEQFLRFVFLKSLRTISNKQRTSSFQFLSSFLKQVCIALSQGHIENFKNQRIRNPNAYLAYQK